MTDSVSNGQLHHDIGDLQARVEALEKMVEKSTEKLNEIHAEMLLYRGGRKALYGLLAAAGATGGLISWALQHLHFK